GVTVREYAANFYGTDYPMSSPEIGTGATGIDSDRVFATWDLSSPRVKGLASGREDDLGQPEGVIEIRAEYATLLKTDPELAKREVLRVRKEFQQALSSGLVCRGFSRDAERPRYLLYRE